MPCGRQKQPGNAGGHREREHVVVVVPRDRPLEVVDGDDDNDAD